MVRAELGNGNRDQAVALLERVQARYVLSSCHRNGTLTDTTDDSLLLFITGFVELC